MAYSLYLHVPFCTHRCAYCDFNTYAGQESLIPAYVEALCREAQWVGSRAPSGAQIHTIFFGGGTPSLLSPIQLGRILASLRDSFAIDSRAEVTLEANPGTVDVERLDRLREAGVNRLSYGVQSANAEELKMLERTHTYLEVLEAVAGARRAGFENINLDLIYGLPEQALQTWQVTVKRVLELEPEHISAYALTLEHGTPFGHWAKRGLMAEPDPDVAADMYEWLTEELAGAGYQQYEISNWCKPGRACRHNLQYWRGLPYLGLGAGAHGYANGFRYSNALQIGSYIAKMQSHLARAIVPLEAVHEWGLSEGGLEFPLSPATISQHRQSVADDMAEFMIMGLRLVREGVESREFLRRFGRDLISCYGDALEHLEKVGLVEWAGRETSEVPAAESLNGESTSEALRLTSRGRLLGNQVFAQFVS